MLASVPKPHCASDMKRVAWKPRPSEGRLGVGSMRREGCEEVRATADLGRLQQLQRKIQTQGEAKSPRWQSIWHRKLEVEFLRAGPPPQQWDRWGSPIRLLKYCFLCVLKACPRPRSYEHILFLKAAGSDGDLPLTLESTGEGGCLFRLQTAALVKVGWRLETLCHPQTRGGD